MMKKNNTKKNRTARKLLPAAGMLAVSASMLATSTYAWFTMNKDVQVTGIAMKTKVGSNLLISSNNAEGTYKADTLVEGRKALLEPVSSATGKTGEFFYTLDAAETGQKAHTVAEKAYIAYAEDTLLANAGAGKYYYDDGFNADYGIESPAATDFNAAYGYVDYVFYLKATGDSNATELRMTQCDLTYNTDDLNTGDNAWRVALFATPLTDDQAGKGNSGTNGTAVGQIDPASSAPKTILKLEDGDYWDDADKAVSGTAQLSAVTNLSQGAVIDNNIAAGTTKYYKVLVRIWLEGEDKSCNSSTYAALTNNWSLDLDFQMTSTTEDGTGKTAVTQISSNTWSAGPNTSTTQNAVTSPIEVVTTASSGG